jgi:hypothetical protein
MFSLMQKVKSRTRTRLNDLYLKGFARIATTQMKPGIENAGGRAMAQAVSRWPLTAEARVRARVSSC